MTTNDLVRFIKLIPEHCRNQELPLGFVCPENAHSVLRELTEWGTYGKGGKESLQFLKLCAMETSHIQAVLDTQKFLSSERRALFEKELEFRRNL